MNGRSMLIVATMALVLAILSGVAISAQDKYTLRVPDGLASLTSKGYEDWQLISSAKTDDRMKVILGKSNDNCRLQIRHSGQRQAVPDGSKIAKVQWKPKKSTEAPFSVEVPDTLADLFFMEKDSKKFPDTGGWAYAQFDYDPASATSRPTKAHTHLRARMPCGREGKGYVFHPYQNR